MIQSALFHETLDEGRRHFLDMQLELTRFFYASLMLADRQAMEVARERAHVLLDSHLDALASCHAALRELGK